jgi:hypothetical protein
MVETSDLFTGTDNAATPSQYQPIEKHRFDPQETILIFDWDDTMLPSSWVADQGLRAELDAKLTKDQEAELNDLSRLAIDTLRIAKTYGTVVLVTNAERGWIELSCQKFMPALFPALKEVKIFSARTEFERPEVTSPFEWKLKAFQCEIDRLFKVEKFPNTRRMNILSFGDSAHEREALIAATADLANCRTKSLKFVEKPRIEHLRKQHVLLARCIERIVHHDGNLDMCLRCS